MFIQVSKKTFVFLIPICMFSIQSHASLFYIDEQSVSTLGNAFAGTGAAGDDASIGFYNPAGLTLIKKGEVVGAVTYAAADIVLNVDSATDATAKPIPGAAGESVFAVPQLPIPALHAAVPINEDWVVGISFTSPFAIETNYSNSAVRGEMSKARFISYNTTLNLAYKVTSDLSLGVGLNTQYMDAVIATDVIATVQGVSETFATTEYRGNDLTLYPTVGLLYEFTPDTRLGLSYRFPTTQDTDGTLDIAINLNNTTQSAFFKAGMDMLLPGIATLSFFHQLTPNIELLADVAFEQWSRWQSLIIDFGQEPQGGVPLHFTDTWRTALGLNYIFNSAIKLRTGIAYDESPVSDEYRNMATPDSDRLELAVGFGISPKSWKKTRIDVGYMHTFFADTPINQDSMLKDITGVNFGIDNSNVLVGDYNSAVDYIGLQIVRNM